ncbi:Abi-alpha family protein [Synechococcus sp. CCAP 1479/13]|nr:Abi-alpha family protein [Synechococcus sp. CCAP 1479/13]
MASHLHHYFQQNPELLDKLALVEKGALPVFGSRLANLIWRSDAILQQNGRESIKLEDLKSIQSDTGDAFVRESQFVEDEELLELWSSLLASYINEAREGRQARKAFSFVLGQLSSFDAQCLKAIYSVDSSMFTPTASLAVAFGWDDSSIGEPRGNDVYSGKGISTVLLPERAFVFDNNLRQTIAEMDQPLGMDLLTSLGNLARLGLIEASTYIDGGSDPRVVFHTGFGLIFSKSIIFSPEP